VRVEEAPGHDQAECGAGRVVVAVAEFPVLLDRLHALAPHGPDEEERHRRDGDDDSPELRAARERWRELREISRRFNSKLRESMLRETEMTFEHVLRENRGVNEFLNSDYTFLNQRLAEHYGISGVKGDAFQRVSLRDSARGGVLGMAGVLTTTSLATRTSPVLRGKWVLEQILGTPPPPPPPDVPELEAAKQAETELGLRKLLALHRSPSTCQSCHQKMDPIGLGLENFDAIGRWRTRYEEVPIDPTGVLVTGEAFQGPATLRKILRTKKKDFAENLSRRMLSYALGRGVQFKDYPTLEHLTEVLLAEDFNTKRLMEELVLSFPFRYKKSDLETNI